MCQYMSIQAKYLVGRKAKLSTFVEPFNPGVVEFLKDFSKELDNQKKTKNYPDLKALSFFL